MTGLIECRSDAVPAGPGTASGPVPLGPLGPVPVGLVPVVVTGPAAGRSCVRSKLSTRRKGRLRARLLARDGARCFYCARPFTHLTPPTFDHVMPWFVRRTWVQPAVVLACVRCNQAKGPKLPHQVVALLGGPVVSASALKRLDPPELLAAMRTLVQHRFGPGLVPLGRVGLAVAA